MTEKHHYLLLVQVDILDIAKLLHNRGAGVNRADKHGQTALSLVCLYNLCPTAELLLIHGADINIMRKDGKTPLSLAKTCKHHDIVRTLLIHNSMPFLRFVYGCGYSEGQNFTDDNVAYSLKRVLGSHDLKRTITGYI